MVFVVAALILNGDYTALTFPLTAVILSEIQKKKKNQPEVIDLRECPGRY